MQAYRKRRDGRQWNNCEDPILSFFVADAHENRLHSSLVIPEQSGDRSRRLEGSAPSMPAANDRLKRLGLTGVR